MPTDAEIVRSAIAAFNDGDLDAALELASEDVVIHDPARTGDVFRGHEAFRSFTGEWLENFDDYRIEITELHEGDDVVVADCIQSGRGKGSGIEVSDEIHMAYRLDAGRIAEYWIFTRRDEALRHAGIEG